MMDIKMIVRPAGRRIDVFVIRTGDDVLDYYTGTGRRPGPLL